MLKSMRSQMAPLMKHNYHWCNIDDDDDVVDLKTLDFQHQSCTLYRV